MWGLGGTLILPPVSFDSLGTTEVLPSVAFDPAQATFLGNSAKGAKGAGIYLESGVQATLTNISITGHVASVSGHLGATAPRLSAMQSHRRPPYPPRRAGAFR